MKQGDKDCEPKGAEPEGSVRYVIMTPSTIVFTLNEEDQKHARRCLERSGKITFNFGEISMSSLTEVRRLDEVAFGPSPPMD